MLLKARRIAALFWRMPVKRCEQGATIMIEPKRRAQNTARPKRPTGKPWVAALGGYAERARATRPNRRGKRAAAGVEADETTRHEGPKPTPRGTHVELLQQGVDVGTTGGRRSARSVPTSEGRISTKRSYSERTSLRQTSEGQASSRQTSARQAFSRQISVRWT